MDEKKTKRQKKGQKKTILSPMLLHIQDADQITKMIDVKIGDETYTVSIKQHLDFQTRDAIIDKAEDIYYPDGIFDQLYGDMLLDFLLIQVYTDLDFGNDFFLFDKFKYLFSDAYMDIANNIPQEAEDIRMAVTSRIDLLSHEKSIPAEQKSFYQSAQMMMDGLYRLIDSLSDVLTQAESSMKDISGDDMKELISAMNYAGKADSKRVAKAVLDYQQEKSKRTAVRENVDTDVPHI